MWSIGNASQHTVLSSPIYASVLVNEFNPLKRSDVGWLHFEVFNAIQV